MPVGNRVDKRFTLLIMKITKLSKKYQVVVPKEVRAKMKLSAGMHVFVHPIDEDYAVISKYSNDSIQVLQSLVQDFFEQFNKVQYIKQERKPYRHSH